MDEPRRLGNRYELGEELGRGGMAEVFMARDLRLGRTVAVKTLRADMARDATLQARFRREAQSAASLNHPAIVAVYDTGEGPIDKVTLPYIVMEYVNGSTLRDILHSGNRLLPERSMEITGGVLEALGYSHRNGIVHRDIKPANIMLNGSAAVKVMDFGIARALGDAGMTLTQTSAVVGTAQYLSPEQAKGERIDARSDLYSTGCLLYELLTGRPPFIGDSPVAVAYQHVREAPKPPSYYDPAIPAVADTIVLKALRKKPEERYQSADEMRTDLECALDGRPLASEAVKEPEPAEPDPAAQAEAAAAAAALAEKASTSSGKNPFKNTAKNPPATTGTGGGADTGGSAKTTAGGGSGEHRQPVAMYAVVGSLAVLLVVLSVILVRTMSGGPAAPTTALVPNIVSQNVGAAKTLLDGRKLTLSTYSDCSGSSSFSLTYPAGEILSQTPAPNATVSPGSVVNYCVSAGARTATLFPSVFKDSSGHTAMYNYNQVYTTLTSNGFTDVQQKQKQDGSHPAGQVVDVVNSAGVSQLGQTIPINTTLYVVVSTGPSSSGSSSATVPTGLVGKSCTAAAGILQSSDGHFRNRQIGHGTVVSVSPGGGSSAPYGSTVTLTCAGTGIQPTNPPAATPTPTPTPTPTSRGLQGLL
ncbi:MAG TPA: Stk1 family PASTA domain-containing Ser/Thr kinase [Actinocrinis sp.]|nr:Stk1 family PASTA domain-containing Ser/Thr kinase [Actinocrinis sp.]